MNTIHLICSCDSLVVKTCEKLCTCSAEVIEPGTNCHDVSVVGTICCTFVHVVLIGVVGFLLWKLIDYIAKVFSGCKRRIWEEKDKDRKQKSDLLEGYLDFLKKQVGNDETKAKQYRKVMEYLITLSQQGKLSEISEEKLNSII